MIGSRGVAAQHERWMRLALEQADLAGANGEVPVGAVLVGPEGEIARGCNGPIASRDPSAHAEIVTLRRAGQVLDNYRMPDTTLYVTIEPCTMCAGAIIHARIGALVFGVREPKAGAVLSRPATLDGLNHKLAVVEGVLEADCRRRVSDFFARKRGVA